METKAWHAATNPDVDEGFGSQGHNLIGIGTGEDFAVTDLVGTEAFPLDPKLEPLGDYGGPTLTMRPLPSNPVINTGLNTKLPDTDQRGLPRIVLGFTDIGAVELQPDEFGGPGASPAPRQSLTWLLPRRAATAGTMDAAGVFTFVLLAAEAKIVPADPRQLEAFFGHSMAGWARARETNTNWGLPKKV